MTTFLWLLRATASTVIGDYRIKRSTALPEGMGSAQFALAALCYGLPAFAWFVMMREHDLAAMGFVGFGEPFSWREGLGVSLALAAVVVMQTGE